MPKILNGSEIGNREGQIIVTSRPDWEALVAELMPEMTPLQKFLRSKLDQTRYYPPPVPILSIVQGEQCVPVLTKKSYSLIQGKQKSKKTTFLVLAAASLLMHAHGIEVPEDQMVYLLGQEKGRILFFDCEQGESYAARTMKLILKVAGLDASDFLSYHDLREFTPVERMGMIKAGLEATPDVVLVVVDGVVDLMNDFMDPKEGHTVVTELLKLCSQYDIHVSGVLHQNKGASKDARAHVGSISSQKCEVEIMAEVDSNNRYLSTIHCKESRGLPFDDFAIQWLPGGLPEIVQSYATVVNDLKPGGTFDVSRLPIELCEDIANEALRLEPEPNYGRICRGVKMAMKDMGYKLGDNRAKEVVTHLQAVGILIKSDDPKRPVYLRV